MLQLGEPAISIYQVVTEKKEPQHFGASSEVYEAKLKYRKLKQKHGNRI